MDRLPGTVQQGSGASGAAMEEGRTARKRRAILKAATEVFLQHGYLGASMDEVAARAAVSKQTVYKQFQDKKHLFSEIILGTTVQVVAGLGQAYASILEETPDVGQALRDLGRRLLVDLTRPDVLQLRRLVLAEADRFPDIATAWFEGAFHRSLVLLGESMTRLADRGALRELPDPTLAAYQFAGLVMYKPMNQVMFAGTAARPAADELDRIADRAAEVFLAAYGRPGPASAVG
ncbi:TetR/AcrR family transcriptional regulator [Rhizohabitans arisaemae]|uniref:TetR/AcrR family transcriptional regulator n=1 Tax=Rhizohabitans arisaemae TaxID=2720610 RepID=UPI0024B271C4|nr:TetR/AcrR family transcriptional regulator [Rhizohabitans arisaemae]